MNEFRVGDRVREIGKEYFPSEHLWVRATVRGLSGQHIGCVGRQMGKEVSKEFAPDMLEYYLAPFKWTDELVDEYASLYFRQMCRGGDINWREYLNAFKASKQTKTHSSMPAAAMPDWITEEYRERWRRIKDDGDKRMPETTRVEFVPCVANGKISVWLTPAEMEKLRELLNS